MLTTLKEKIGCSKLKIWQSIFNWLSIFDCSNRFFVALDYALKIGIEIKIEVRSMRTEQAEIKITD